MNEHPQYVLKGKRGFWCRRCRARSETLIIVIGFASRRMEYCESCFE